MMKLDTFEILPPSHKQIHGNSQSIAEAVTQFTVFIRTVLIRYRNRLPQNLYPGVSIYYVLLQLVILSNPSGLFHQRWGNQATYNCSGASNSNLKNTGT